MATKTFDCLICADEHHVSTRVECPDGHPLSDECLGYVIKSQTSDENRTNFAKQDQNIICVFPKCGKPYDEAVIFRAGKESRILIQKAITQLELKSALEERDRDWKKIVEEKEKGLLALVALGNTTALKERQISQHRRYIIERILTFHCGHCDMVIFEWDACMAVRCANCRNDFCGWCLKVCGKDAHPHVKICDKNPKKGEVFGSVENKNKAWNKQRMIQIQEYIKQQVMPEDVILLKNVIEKDLAELPEPMVFPQIEGPTDDIEWLLQNESKQLVDWVHIVEPYYRRKFNIAIGDVNFPLDQSGIEFFRRQIWWLGDQQYKNNDGCEVFIKTGMAIEYDWHRDEKRDWHRVSIDDVRQFDHWFDGILERIPYLQAFWKQGLLFFNTRVQIEKTLDESSFYDQKGEMFALRFSSIERFQKSQLVLNSVSIGCVDKIDESDGILKRYLTKVHFKGDIEFFVKTGWWSIRTTDQSSYQKDNLQTLLKHMQKYVYIVKNDKGINKALDKLSALEK